MLSMRRAICNVVSSRLGLGALVMTESSRESDPDAIDAHTQFHNAYGGAMAAWARLEGCLFYWFMSASGMNEAPARAIFFSARSFAGRRDMLWAILPFALFDQGAGDVIRAGLNKAQQYSEFRNKLAHREPVVDIRRESPTWAQILLVEGRDASGSPDAITISQLAAAMRNFDELRRLLWQVHPLERHPGTDAEGCLRLIRELPNQAHSREAARTPEGTQR